ncbi:cytochrome P450 [Hyalangium minutum]|uniref:Putative cytochrome P450 hydroxylase n=1 Tax=Hyalangium minutum TaxID=394096 RepID=A0A085WJ19_9BACT|nr:cytochrome P450 [Hyalangium minutum]KFE67682.1 putative cytochrome P450 hydroxylase [Hyalangium minutum]
MTTLAAGLDVNVVSPQNLLDPNPLYRYLRESEPVHWSEPMQSWFITRHEDVAACFRDPRLSAARTQLFYAHQLRGVGLEKVKDQIYNAERQMLMKDGPEHARLRRNANPGFTLQAIDGWRPEVRKAADALLERVQARGRMELVADYSELLPSQVIMEFFAIPARDQRDFLEWCSDNSRLFAASTGADMQELAVRSNTAIVKLMQYLGKAVQERRANPGRDMLSTMVHAQEEGKLDEGELIANAILILTAGHITTVDQLSNGVHMLLTHPEQLRKLRENPGLMKSTVEEVLRFCPAVPFIHRIAAEDFELRGRKIQKGQLVFLGMAAANRDPAVFPDPERFDITRQNNKHLSFAFGPHMCLGAPLARVELEIGFTALLERMPGLRLDEEQPPRIKCNSLVFRGFDSLPVRW